MRYVSCLLSSSIPRQMLMRCRNHSHGSTSPSRLSRPSMASGFHGENTTCTESSERTRREGALYKTHSSTGYTHTHIHTRFLLFTTTDWRIFITWDDQGDGLSRRTVNWENYQSSGRRTSYKPRGRTRTDLLHFWGDGHGEDLEPGHWDHLHIAFLGFLEFFFLLCLYTTYLDTPPIHHRARGLSVRLSRLTATRNTCLMNGLWAGKNSSLPPKNV